MMQKHVYGKRAARSGFTVSNIFTVSSPAKTDSRPATRADEILQASDALKGLTIEDNELDSSPIRPRRRVLGSRDANSRTNTKQSSQGRSIKCTNVTTQQKQKTEDEKLCARQRETGPTTKKTQDTSQCSLSDSPPVDDLCHPHVRRLIALTNEQQVPLKFEEWSNTLAQHFGISKIAEASYSEVYRLSLLDQHPTLTTADESVLKLIAIKPPFHDVCTKKTKAQQRREEDMSSVSDIMSEVRLLKRMTEIPGFTNYRALHILQGRPSQPFIQAWKEWNKARRKGEKSEFPDPGRKASYDEDQYWAVIEMQDAGTDVERLLEVQVKEKDDRVEDGTAIRSIWATWDIFWQTVLAVAKGESEARFEHRDLHLGNICVRRKDGSEEHTATEDGLERKLGFSNFETTIIDYTLSRADMSTLVPSRPQSSYSGTSGSSLASASSITSTDIEIAYNPLQNQPKIFEGDAEVDYQYEIYRYMRTIVGSGSLSEGDIWHPYQPKTNILWLHFILHKLCETLQWPSETAKRSQTKRQMKALELEEVLAQVENLLNIERLMGEEECLLTSAAELVAVALEQGWLDQEDINS